MSARFDVVQTGGGLRVKRHLLRVHLRGHAGPGWSLYVGQSFSKPGWHYVSEMAYETVKCQHTRTLNGAIEKAKKLLLARSAAQMLGAE